MQNQIGSDMNVEERAKIILKIICPLLIVSIPIFLILFFRMPNPAGEGYLDWQWYALISVMCVSGWIFSIIYVLSLIGFIDKLRK